METPTKKLRRNLFFNPLLYIIITSSFFASIGGFMIIFSSMRYSKVELNRVVARMHEGIRYKKGIWNVLYLDSDPELPGSYPHYIISSDGHVIERWKPIGGYLDTTNLDYILSFTSPQTVTTPLKEKWRVFSKPIQHSNQTYGGILVASYMNEYDNPSLIDQRLKTDMSYIESNIKASNDSFDISNLDLRHIRYDTSVRIVDKYNQIIARTNNSKSKDRVPNSMDKSYIGQEIKSNNEKIIRDKKTGEPFLVLKSPIYDENNHIVGAIIVAKSLSFLVYIFINYLLSFFALSAIIFPTIWYIDSLINKQSKSKTIKFNKNDGTLYIESTPIEIPLKSHQYYLTKRLFQNPKKAVGADEISIQVAESAKQNVSIKRKVYDAMILVNKKVEPLIDGKLFILRNKKFFINPEYLDNIR